MVSSESPVGWGVVGCGWVARDYVVPAMLASPEARLVALCDPDPRSAAAMAERGTGVAVSADLAAFLATPGLDAVYVATPNAAHRSVVEAAAAAGKAVLCEKPVAADVADAERLVAAVRSAGVPAGVAFDQRWHPAHAVMREWIAAGVLGTVTAVRITYGCWLPPAWSPDGRPYDNWRTDPARAGGGALVDLAPHGLDLAGTLLDDDLVALQVILQRRVHDYPVDDGAALVGRTDRGVLVTAHVAYNTPDQLPRRRLEVVGTQGQLTATDTMGQTAGGRLEFCSAAQGWCTPVDFDAEASPFVGQIDGFSRAVRDARGPHLGPAWPYPLERDLALHRLLFAAARTADTTARLEEPA
jgi:predicted dehydrogenase